MVPIPGLDSVLCSWVTIQAEGYHLHGFLLYTASDHYFPEYIDGEGLGDLDIWTGPDCAVFVVHSPSERWIEYTKATDHVWWKLFGHHTDSAGDYLTSALRDYGNVAILEIGSTRKTLQELFAPCLNKYLHGQEIANVLRHFDLQATQHPCLVLFKDLKDRIVWYVDMSDMVDMAERDLRKSLKRWFAGRQFKNLLRETAHA